MVCVVESRFLCLSIACVVFGQFLILYPLERWPLRHYWNLFEVASQFWRQKMLPGKYRARFLSQSELGAWSAGLNFGVCVPGQGSVQLHFVSNCRCLSAIWASLFIYLFI